MTTPEHGGRIGGRLSPTGKRVRNLTLRLASAVVLGPLVLVCTYAGGSVFLVLCAAAAAGILWEWTRLLTGTSDWRILAPGLAALGATLVLTLRGDPELAAMLVVVAAAAAAAMAALRPFGTVRSSAALWAGGGIAYAGAAFFGPALLRRDPHGGLTALLFLFATVWASDIFAYFCGRAVGGPRLWPSVSPNKTWAGAIGGTAGGVAAGAAVAYASGIGELGMAGAMALLLSIVAQAGDLFESAVKRRFGAKDASQLIPGHGGLMDRLDGFLVAAFVALVIGLVRQGPDAPARGLLAW